MPAGVTGVTGVKNYRVAQLDQVPPTPCPCGQARRAFAAARVRP